MVAAVGAGVLLGTPGAAFAHGVGGNSETAGGFVWLGFTHMLLGWDHLLFIAGVVLLAGQGKRAAKLISVFAAGHSTTLIVATLAGWRFNATLVDIVIALSLAFVGVVGWSGRPTRWRWFAAGVLGFGFIHGLGLSTRLQELGVHHDGTLARVIAFNIGVEIGQLLAVFCMFMLGDVVWYHLRRHISWSTTWRTVHAGLMIVGLVTGAVLAATAGRDTSPTAGRDTSPSAVGGGGQLPTPTIQLVAPPTLSPQPSRMAVPG